MKKITWFLPVAVIILTIGCKEVTGGQAGLDMANLDTTVMPGTDFFQFATGGWNVANPIPDEYSSYGSFDKLGEQNQVQVRMLIEELSKTKHKAGSVAQKIGDLYRISLDSVKLNKEGDAPILEQIATIRNATTREEVIALMTSMRRSGLAAFFGLYVGADDKNSSMNILHAYQGGLGIGDRDYYLLQDDASKKIREGYISLIEKQFINTGFTAEEASKASSAIMKIETTLAIAHYEKEKLRMPELNYHKWDVAQLNDSVAPFDWGAFFKGAGIRNLKFLNVSQPEPIAAAIGLINTASVEDLKAYLNWTVINRAAGYLSDNFINADFDFYGRQLSGTLTLQPRWKRAVNTVNGFLGEAVGQLYVETYFPPKAKRRMLKLVENLKASLGERINSLEWMSDETKAKAQEKLGAFYVKIGYPDKWRDYSALEIRDDSYWANIVRACEFENDYQLSKLGKPVDKDEWLMNAHEVNAYYNPSTNEICFPAGILQPPFFFMNGDDAINYGAIGVVIGHEMTHGFDDQGRKYDKEGNLSEWWMADDATRFNERSRILVSHFDSIVVLDNLHANGTYTLGENIADNGGLQVAYNAFLKTRQSKSEALIDGYKPKQRFFLAYANLWAGNTREEEMIRLTMNDSHSLGKWRVNGSLPHINAWYEAFNITKKNPMYLPVEKRASIW